jgi:hypothetical protein
MSVTKKHRDRIALSGFTVLGIGAGLLVFTFVSACVFLATNLQILTTQDFVQAFGEALAPLIAASIRVMYLGVMGWIGSLMTIRGVTMITNAPKTETAITQKTEEPQQKFQPQPVEPELVVLPLEEIERQQQVPQDS